MPRETYQQIVARQKPAQATIEQQVDNAYLQRKKQEMTVTEQAATNADKVLEKSPTDEFTDLRSAIDIVHIAMNTLSEINGIPNLSEMNRESLKNEYRVLQNLYFRMLKEEHELFAKVFQGDEE